MNFQSLLAIFAYILLAVGLYSIAKRRGIQKPWLAWIPVANIWTLGCISDQYQYVAKGQTKSKRKVMLALTIVGVVLVILIVVMALNWLGTVLSEADLSMFTEERIAELADMEEQELIQTVTDMIASSIPLYEDVLIDSLGTLLGIAGLSLALTVLGIWLLVLEFMAYYDLFMSSVPANAGLFTILGIVASFFGLSIVMSLLVCLSRGKDDGMPPRRDQAAQQMDYAPAESWGQEDSE